MRSRMSSTVAVMLLLCPIGRAAYAAPNAPEEPCNDALVRKIPERPAGAPSGSEFVEQIRQMDSDTREAAILGQLLAGNIPGFLRHLKPIDLSGGPAREPHTHVTLCVSPDYLAIGSDQNFLLIPMRLQTALQVANRFRFMLPTRKIVDAIHAQAQTHLRPQPLPAGDTMRTTAYYRQHNELVREQREALSGRLGLLTDGDKKDLVLTNLLWTHLTRVAIYGWHTLAGSPIQPLSTVHGARYADYSHGARLVSDTAYVDGKAKSLPALLEDSRLAALVSDEGEIRHISDLISILSSQPMARAAAERPIH